MSVVRLPLRRTNGRQDVDMTQGNTKIPTIIGLTSFVAFRQVYSFVMSKIWNLPLPVGMAYPAGWILAAITIIIYYHKVKNRKSTLVDA